MDILDLMKNRFSVRKFKDTKVDDDLINLIIEAAMCAPTAKNLQPFRIKVIKSSEAIERLKKCTPCSYNAPLAFLITYMEDECFKREFDEKLSGDIDTSIVITQMMLEATNLGLGTCWVMYFNPTDIKREFGLKMGEIPNSILLCGYNDDYSASPSHKNKKAKEDIVEVI